MVDLTNDFLNELIAFVLIFLAMSAYWLFSSALLDLEPYISMLGLP